MAQPKDHKPPPEWLVPYAPGKNFVIPDTIEQYRQLQCHEPFHIFREEGRNCKCKRYFWAHADQRTQSRTIRIPLND